MANAAPDKTNINLNILKETDARLEELMRLTFRGNKGSVIDWLVAEHFNRAAPCTSSPTPQQQGA